MSKIKEICQAVRQAITNDSELKGDVYIGIDGEARESAAFPYFVVSPGSQPQKQTASGGEKTYYPEIEIYAYVMLQDDAANLEGNSSGDVGVLDISERLEQLFEGSILGGIVEDIQITNVTWGSLYMGGQMESCLGARVDLRVEYYS